MVASWLLKVPSIGPLSPQRLQTHPLPLLFLLLLLRCPVEANLDQTTRDQHQQQKGILHLNLQKSEITCWTVWACFISQERYHRRRPLPSRWNVLRPTGIFLMEMTARNSSIAFNIVLTFNCVRKENSSISSPRLAKTLSKSTVKVFILSSNQI